MRWIRAVVAALLLVAMLAIPPWALVTFIGHPWPAEGISLSAPFTDGAIIGLLAAAVWLLWAQLVVCVIVEAIAALSGDRIQLRAPLTLGVQQQLARRLVTAIVVATVSTPVAIGGAETVASADTPHAPGTTTQLANQDHAAGDDIEMGYGYSVRDRGAAGGTSTTPAGAHTDRGQATVTVMRLDTLMGIADRVLGDENRWEEIAALNEGRTMNDGSVFRSADYLRPGWELALPSDPAPTAPTGGGRHVVEPGDTLAGIAHEQLGDADRYPAIFRASRNIMQPGGEHLVDPDHIEPGWVVQLPRRHHGTGADRQQSPGNPDQGDRERGDQEQGPGGGDLPPEQQDQEPPTAGEEPPQWETPERTAQSMAPTTPDTVDKTAGVEADADQVVEQDGGIGALDALLASAACLSAGALGLLLNNRRRQWRERRIGRVIASTPDELVDVERSIVEHGTAAHKDAEFLDRALRHVAASCKVADAPLPPMGAAVLGDEDLTLLFTLPAEANVPEGWTATDDARAWMLPRGTTLEEELENQPPPYPALVSVGLDEGGHTWYLDLETLGMCGIGGDPHQVADFVRFMVAELAVNTWAEGCEVLLADEFAAETVRLNPTRLRQVGRSDALARAAVLTDEMAEGEQNLDAEVLTRRRDGLLLDTASPVVVVVSSRPTEDFVTDIEARDRSRIVVVHGDEESPAVELAGDGMAFLPMWGISVKAFALQAEHAAPMADLMRSTRNLDDEPMPVMAYDDGPLGKYALADGSLREAYTSPRRTEGNDSSSMLPEADEVYLATAATTTEDLATVAPSVPAEVRAEIAALDPTLDQDVGDWFDPASTRPKVHLLGPVEVNAVHGGDPGALTNLGGTISFIAYLAVQDHGVTGERAAAACGWKTQKTVQNRATNARFLLGTRPDGSDWLPDASVSAGALRGTSPTYELVRDPGGVLINGDLFIRLKNRAERRGDDGCEADLAKALSLVTGAPFEAATESRFKWLFRAGQQRHDEILVAAIHDAAHVLATRAISEGRTDLVRMACDAARKASPHSDVAWLDEAAATEAESGRTDAGELVREQVLDRFDEDLPARSESIVEQREWGAAG